MKKEPQGLKKKCTSKERKCFFFFLVWNGSSKSAPKTIIRVLASSWRLLVWQRKDSWQRVTKRWGGGVSLRLLVASIDNIAAATATYWVARGFNVHSLLNLLQVLARCHGVHLWNRQLVAVTTTASSKGLVGRSKVLNGSRSRRHASKSLEFRWIGLFLCSDFRGRRVIAKSTTSSENHFFLCCSLCSNARCSLKWLVMR